MPETKVVPFAAAADGGQVESAAAKFAGEETVTMVFPRAVQLTLDNHQVVKFSPGPQQVPVRLKDHWYLKANKVITYEAAAAEASKKNFVAPVPDHAVNDHHVRYLQSKGYPVDDEAAAKVYIGDLSEPARMKFFQDAAEWKEPDTLVQVDLETMSKPELVAFAKEKYDLEINPRASKAAILEAIENAAA